MGQFYNTSQGTFIDDALYERNWINEERKINLLDAKTDDVYNQGDLLDKVVTTTPYLNTENQRKAFTERQEYYKNNIEAITKKMRESPQDYNLYSEELRKLRNDLTEDISSGTLYDLRNKYDTYATWADKNKDKSPDVFDYYQRKNLYDIEQSFTEDPKKQIQLKDVQNHYDIEKESMDLLKDVKGLEYSKEKKMYIMEGREVTPQRLTQIIASKLKSDPNFLNYVDQSYEMTGDDRFYQNLAEDVEYTIQVPVMDAQGNVIMKDDKPVMEDEVVKTTLINSNSPFSGAIESLVRAYTQKDEKIKENPAAIAAMKEKGLYDRNNADNAAQIYMKQADINSEVYLSGKNREQAAYEFQLKQYQDKLKEAKEVKDWNLDPAMRAKVIGFENDIKILNQRHKISAGLQSFYKGTDGKNYPIYSEGISDIPYSTKKGYTPNKSTEGFPAPALINPATGETVEPDDGSTEDEKQGVGGGQKNNKVKTNKQVEAKAPYTDILYQNDIDIHNGKVKDATPYQIMQAKGRLFSQGHNINEPIKDVVHYAKLSKKASKVVTPYQDNTSPMDLYDVNAIKDYATHGSSYMDLAIASMTYPEKSIDLDKFKEHIRQYGNVYKVVPKNRNTSGEIEMPSGYKEIYKDINNITSATTITSDIDNAVGVHITTKQNPNGFDLFPEKKWVKTKEGTTLPMQKLALDFYKGFNPELNDESYLSFENSPKRVVRNLMALPRNEKGEVMTDFNVQGNNINFKANENLEITLTLNNKDVIKTDYEHLDLVIKAIHKTKKK